MARVCCKGLYTVFCSSFFKKKKSKSLNKINAFSWILCGKKVNFIVIMVLCHLFPPEMSSDCSVIASAGGGAGAASPGPHSFFLGRGCVPNDKPCYWTVPWKRRWRALLCHRLRAPVVYVKTTEIMTLVSFFFLKVTVTDVK